MGGRCWCGEDWGWEREERSVEADPKCRGGLNENKDRGGWGGGGKREVSRPRTELKGRTETSPIVEVGKV